MKEMNELKQKNQALEQEKYLVETENNEIKEELVNAKKCKCWTEDGTKSVEQMY